MRSSPWRRKRLTRSDHQALASSRSSAALRPLTKEPLIKSIMDRVADKNGMIARRTTPVVVILRCQGAQHRERPFLSQPLRALALRAVCGVRLLAKGAVATRYWRRQPLAGATACDHSRTNRFAHRVMVATIRFVAFLASHPAKPNARPCGT
jgi:hypothetical protein